MHARATMPTAVGTLTLIASDDGLRAVLWEVEKAGRVKLPSDITDDPSHPVIAEALVQLREYFDGERTTFTLPLDLHGTAFQRSVWLSLAEIPYGTTVSYAQQARRLGDVNKTRAVGMANGRNPVSIVLPCHRVIGSDGSLTGFAAGLDVKRFLLDLETKASLPECSDESGGGA